MQGLDLANIDCSQQESLTSVASNMEDLADFIDEVGLDNLKTQFGIEALFDINGLN